MDGSRCGWYFEPVKIRPTVKAREMRLTVGFISVRSKAVPYLAAVIKERLRVAAVLRGQLVQALALLRQIEGAGQRRDGLFRPCILIQ